jgi:hypothetical protein
MNEIKPVIILLGVILVVLFGVNVGVILRWIKGRKIGGRKLSEIFWKIFGCKNGEKFVELFFEFFCGENDPPLRVFVELIVSVAVI